MKNKKIILSSVVLATALLGTQAILNIEQQLHEQNIQHQYIENAKYQEQLDKEEENYTYDKDARDSGNLVDSSAIGASATVSDFDPLTGEVTISWTLDVEKFFQQTGNTSDDVNTLEIILVNTSAYEARYGSDPAFLSDNNLVPEDEGWGNRINVNGLVNDWYTEYDGEDAGGSGFEEIVYNAENGVDGATKSTVPVATIRTSGTVYPTRTAGASAGTVRVRNLIPGTTYDAIMFRVKSRLKSDLDSDAATLPNNGYPGAYLTDTGGNLSMTKLVPMESITIPYSTKAIPTFSQIIPEGQEDWIAYSNLNTTDGENGTVDATINFGVMEDNDANNNNSSKSDITAINITSEKAGVDVNLTEDDYDDIVDRSSAKFTNPYVPDMVYDTELPDPLYERTSTEHSFTFESLKTNMNYDDFNAHVTYESNQNAIKEGEYNNLGAGETTAVVEEMDVPFEIQTPDLGASQVPIISSLETTEGSVAQTNVNVSFNIQDTGLDTISYNPIVTKVEITGSEITGGSIDLTGKGDASGNYTIELTPENSTILANQTINDLKVVVEYTEQLSGDTLSVTADLPEYTTADKVESSIDTVAASASGVTNTTGTIDWSFTPVDETTTTYGTTATLVELLDSSDNVVDSQEITTETSGSFVVDGLISNTEQGPYKVRVTYDSGSTTDKTVTSSDVTFNTVEKTHLDAPSISDIEVAPLFEDATITYKSTNVDNVAETDETYGREITSLNISSASTPGVSLTDVTPTGATILGLESGTTYSDFELTITWNEIVDGTNVENTTSAISIPEFTTDINTIINPLPDQVVPITQISGTSYEFDVTYEGKDAALAVNKLNKETVTHDGKEYQTDLLENPTVVGENTLVKFVVSGLDEGTTLGTDGWAIGTKEEGYDSFTIDSEITTGYENEAILNATYGMNILNSSYGGTSFQVQLLFDDVMNEGSWLQDIKVIGNGTEFTTTYIDGSIRSDVLDGKTLASFEVSGLDPLTAYTTWEVQALDADYMTSARYYNKDHLTITGVEMEQYVIDPETQLPVDKDGNVVEDLEDLTGGNTGEIVGSIDIDGDGKDDTMVKWPDGSFEIWVDGDKDVSIKIEGSSESGWSVTWPAGVFPGNDGGTTDVTPPTTNDDGNLVWEIPGLGDAIDINGDGLPDGLDIDGDGEIDITWDFTIPDFSKPTGFDNEAIISIEKGMMIDESNVTSTSMQFEVEVLGRITDVNSDEFQSVEFWYQGTKLESNVIGSNGNKVRYEITGLTPSTIYSVDGWKVKSLNPDYLSPSRTEFSDYYITQDITLSTEIKTADAPSSNAWIWWMLLMIITLGLIAFLLFYFLFIKNKDNNEKEKVVEEKTTKQSSKTEDKKTTEKPKKETAKKSEVSLEDIMKQTVTSIKKQIDDYGYEVEKGKTKDYYAQQLVMIIEAEK